MAKTGTDTYWVLRDGDVDPHLFMGRVVAVSLEDSMGHSDDGAIVEQAWQGGDCVSQSVWLPWKQHLGTQACVWSQEGLQRRLG